MLAAAAATILTSGAQAAAPFQLGAYLTNPNGSDPVAEATFEANFRSFSQALGHAPTLLDLYIDKTQAIANWPSSTSWQAWSNSQSPVAKKMIPVIGFPLASTVDGPYDLQFQSFYNGLRDASITGVVNTWVAAGFKTLIMRVGWEMNITGPTYVGDDAQSQADWVRAFQHVYTVMHQAAAAAGATIQVMWNPNATNYSNAEAVNSLYPGDAYVDSIGADIYGGMYPFSDGSGTQIHDWVTGAEDGSVAQFIAEPRNRAHYWTFPAATKWSQDGSNGHSQSMLSLMRFAIQHKKPFSIPETGAGAYDDGHDVSDDGEFPFWLARILKNEQGHGLNVSFVAIWDTNDWGHYQFSYPSDHKPAERKAWGADIGAMSK